MTKCGPQDGSWMEAVLDYLRIRRLGSAMMVTIPQNLPLQTAVSCFWGICIWAQRCLNTVIDEALSGLETDQMLQFHHHLQRA